MKIFTVAFRCFIIVISSFLSSRSSSSFDCIPSTVFGAPCDNAGKKEGDRRDEGRMMREKGDEREWEKDGKKEGDGRDGERMMRKEGDERE